MLQDQYLNYIQRKLLALAVKKYPNEPQLQMLYQIGFVQAVLAEFMHKDNQYAHKFSDRIDALLEE